MGLLRKTAVNCAVQHVLHTRNPLDLEARLLLDSLPFLQGQFVDCTRTSDPYAKLTKEDILQAINKARAVLEESKAKDAEDDHTRDLPPLPERPRLRFSEQFSTPVVKPMFTVRLNNVV